VKDKAKDKAKVKVKDAEHWREACYRKSARLVEVLQELHALHSLVDGVPAPMSAAPRDGQEIYLVYRARLDSDTGEWIPDSESEPDGWYPVVDWKLVDE
jgi:hypothetical protein